MDQVIENRDLSIAWKKDLQVFSLPHLMLPSKLQTLLMSITLVLTLTSEVILWLSIHFICSIKRSILYVISFSCSIFFAQCSLCRI